MILLDGGFPGTKHGIAPYPKPTDKGHPRWQAKYNDGQFFIRAVDSIRLSNGCPILGCVPQPEHEVGDELGGVSPLQRAMGSTHQRARKFFVSVHISWTVYTKAHYPYPAVPAACLRQAGGIPLDRHFVVSAKPLVACHISQVKVPYTSITCGPCTVQRAGNTLVQATVGVGSVHFWPFTIALTSASRYTNGTQNNGKTSGCNSSP